LRRLIEVLVRIDPGLWYALDLPRRSALSWIPVAILVGLFAFGAAECLLAGNVTGAEVLFAVVVTVFVLKLGSAAHS